MAELIRETFKERLFYDRLWQSDAVFPSPAQLKGRVIIQGEKPSAAATKDDDSSDDEVNHDEKLVFTIFYILCIL